MNKSKSNHSLFSIITVLLLFSMFLIFDVKAQEENTWTSLAPMPIAGRGLGIAAVDSKIYAIGGKSGTSGYTYTNKNFEYNPTTNTWTTKTPMPTARSDFGITTYQNKIYCFGGYNGSNLDIIETYDPTIDIWETLTPMPGKRAGITANTIEDTIYIVTKDKIHYAYDPQTDSWTRKASMIDASGIIVSVVFEGKIHVFSSPHPDTPNFHQIYDPKTDSWSQGEPLIAANYYPVAVAITGEYALRRICVFGMASNNWYFINTPSLTGQSYDPKTGNWSKIDFIPSGHLDGGAAVIDDRIYLIGGGHAEWFGANQITPRFLNDMYTPFLFGSIPQISISSPENKIYSQVTIPLKFLVNDSVVWMGYSLDNQENVTITGEDYWFSAENIFGTNLTRLSEGTHKLTVYGRDHVGDEGSTTVTFTVDTLPPIITFLSPQNQSYTDANVTLSVNLNEVVSDLKYSLDGLENVTFTGNATLSDFDYGEHNVIVYATDLAGHSSTSEILYFSVEPFPTIPLLTSVGIIAIVGLGIFAYFKKYRK